MRGEVISYAAMCRREQVWPNNRRIIDRGHGAPRRLEAIGLFHLVDGWTEHDGRRLVFRFVLELTPDPEHGGAG